MRVEKGMVDQQLVAYIQQQLASGYSAADIRGTLLSDGYGAAQVQAALAAAYQKQVPPAAHRHFLIVLVVLVMIVMGVVAFLALRPESGGVPAQLLDVELTAAQESVVPGAELMFTVDLVNLGGANRYDVVLTHTVFDELDSPIPGLTKQESMALETRASKTTRFALPATLPIGRYILKTTVRYNGQEAVASLPFAVARQEVFAPRPITPTIPVPSAAVPELTPSLRPLELDEVTELAKSDPALAVQLCEAKFTEVDARDSCYLEIALIASREEVCPKIVGVNKRDTCYVRLALDKGQFSLCQQIQDQNTKEACATLG